MDSEAILVEQALSTCGDSAGSFEKLLKVSTLKVSKVVVYRLS